MAPPPAHQKNNKLVDVGLAGFALVDEFYGREPKKFRGDKLPATTQAYDHDHYHQQKNSKVVKVSEEVWLCRRSSKKSGAQTRQKNNKLVEVGKEGFAPWDEFYGREPKKSRGNNLPATTQAYDHDHDNQQNHHNQQSCSVTVREPVINNNETAQLYGGMHIVDYSIRKPIRRAY